MVVEKPLAGVSAPLRGEKLFGSLLILVSILLWAGWPAAAAKSRVTFLLWNATDTTGKAIRAAADDFQRLYPDIEIELQGGWSPDKFMTTAIGGVPPDLVFVDGPVVSSWALRGLISPLDKYIQAARLSPREFVPPAWRQNDWNGHVWAMTLIVDPNFALVWNKDLFARAGLDPERSPATVADFDKAFQRLTVTNPDGSLKQIGMVPWDVFGHANTIYTWGWIFGGEFFDYQANKATADDVRNIKALTYLRGYFDQYNGLVAPLSQGLPSNYDRFMNRREAMVFSHTGRARNVVTYAPDLDFGIGPLPYDPEGGDRNPTWVGGWTVAIPTGAKNPDAAWAFLRYITASPEGTKTFAEGSGWFPAFLRSPAFQTFQKDRVMRPFVDILLKAAHQRPVIPVQQTYWDELNIALTDTFAHRIQPAEALARVSERVQAELAKVMAGK